MKRVYLFLILLFFITSPVFAQSSTPNLESCFTYYDFGKISAHLATEQANYTKGQTLKIRGTIINNGRTPLINVTLYAHLKRINTSDSFAQNGHYLIDRLRLLENLAFLPKESKYVEVSLPLATSYPNGQYQLQYFLFSAEGFHYGGRPFLEEDTAGYSNFTLNQGIEPLVYFDPASLKVNGTPYPIRSLTTQLGEETLRFSAKLVKNNQQSTIPLTISWYSFEDSLEAYLISREKTTLPGASQTVETIFTPPYPGAFVMVMEVDTPVRSLLKYRFAKTGLQANMLRMNDLGVTNFPATLGKDRAYVCFHSPTENNAPETTVTLSLLNKDKKVIDQVSLKQEFGPQVQAISLPINKLPDSKDFWLRAEFGNASGTPQIVEKHYSCTTFAQSQKNVAVEYDSNNQTLKLKATNSCDQPISKGYIEQLQIVQEGKIVEEAYNLTDIPVSFPAKKLIPGDYQARIRVAGAEKTIPMPVSKKNLPRKNVWLIGIIVGTIVVTITAGTYFWRKRKSQVKEV